MVCSMTRCSAAISQDTHWPTLLRGDWRYDRTLTSPAVSDEDELWEEDGLLRADGC